MSRRSGGRPLAANLLSAVLVTTALTARLADGARIVSVGSIAARRGAGSYGAAKAALEAWTASVARELGLGASPRTWWHRA